MRQCLCTRRALNRQWSSQLGIIITWKPRLIHVALGQLGSPVPQGPDVITSLERFEHYIYGEIVRTPLSKVQNCVVDPLVAPGRFCNLFHRLPEDHFFNAKLKIEEAFVTGGSPTAQWSVNVSAPSGAANSLLPHSPLGTVLKVTGGVGVGIGAVVFEVVHFPAGIFRA